MKRVELFRYESRRGLILLDYIISVAMIAVMTTILFPVFAQAREAARKTSCRTNLHQIGLALHLYARDHDGRLPVGRYMTPLLGAYMPTLTAFRCPSEIHGVQVGTTRLGASNPDAVSWSSGRPVPPAGTLYCSYQYGGGLTLESPRNTPVAGDYSFLHQERAMTLNLAGEVHALSRADWRPYALDPVLPVPGAPQDRRTPHLREPGGKTPPLRPALGGANAPAGNMPGAGMPGGLGP